jgi:hypothetical protein
MRVLVFFSRDSLVGTPTSGRWRQRQSTWPLAAVSAARNVLPLPVRVLSGQVWRASRVGATSSLQAHLLLRAGCGRAVRGGTGAAQPSSPSFKLPHSSRVPSDSLPSQSVLSHLPAPSLLAAIGLGVGATRRPAAPHAPPRESRPQQLRSQLLLVLVSSSPARRSLLAPDKGLAHSGRLPCAAAADCRRRRTPSGARASQRTTCAQLASTRSQVSKRAATSLAHHALRSMCSRSHSGRLLLSVCRAASA